MFRLGRWCVRRRRVVFAIWIGLFVLLGTGSALLGSNYTTANLQGSSDSTSAYNLLAQAEGSSVASAKTGTIVWQTKTGSATSQTIQSEVKPALAQVAKVPGVFSVSSPFVSGHGSQVSGDGRTAYATVTFTTTSNEGQVEAIASSLNSPGLTVQTGGSAFTTHHVSEGPEIIGVLAALLLLFFVFRSVRTAFLPIITGLVGVAAAILSILLLSNAVSLPDTTPTLGALIGLGVGIDYSLFIVNRVRARMLAGVSVEDSVGQALDTSGRAVFFAGTTVIISLLGMLVLGVSTLSGMAIGAAMTVAITVLSATTLLPALVGRMGTKVLSRQQRKALESGTLITSSASKSWSRWADATHAHPARFVLAGLAILLVLASPAWSIQLGSADASSDPPGSATHAFYETMSTNFGPGFDAPLLIVASTPSSSAVSAFDRLPTTLSRTTDVASVSTPLTLNGKGVSLLSVIPKTNAQSSDTATLVDTIRNQVVPSAEAGTDLRIHVGGPTASGIDLASTLSSKLPLFLAVIALLGFVLLAIAFRSLVVPLIGAVSNIGTILVGLGVTTVVFQHGVGSSLLGIGTAAPVEYIVPVFVIGIMFGLSMDYQVFLLSRIREEWVHHGHHTRAVIAGVSDAGRVIATAAMIMFCVFGSFAFGGGRRIVTELGVALAVAVVYDAFVVRLTVMPALLHLIGKRAWAFPERLDRVVPRISVEGHEYPTQPPEPTPALVLVPEMSPRVNHH